MLGSRWSVRVAVAAATSVLVAGLWYYFSQKPFQGDTSGGPSYIVNVDPALRGTDLSLFVGTHGPWLTANQAFDLRNQTGVRNLALLYSNGNVQYSASTYNFGIAPKGPWQPASSPAVPAVKVSGTVATLTNTSGKVFILNVTEPFVMEGSLDTAFTIGSDGNIYQASLGSLTTVTSTGTGSDLPPNPDLSPGF